MTVEDAITELVRSAPVLDAAVITRLTGELCALGTPLALAIARVVELVGEGLVDPGIALPPLAAACATLQAGIEGRFGPAELEAARYEIETLLPVPSLPRPVVPDVPVTRLSRGSRR